MGMFWFGATVGGLLNWFGTFVGQKLADRKLNDLREVFADRPYLYVQARQLGERDLVAPCDPNDIDGESSAEDSGYPFLSHIVTHPTGTSEGPWSEFKATYPLSEIQGPMDADFIYFGWVGHIPSRCAYWVSSRASSRANGRCPPQRSDPLLAAGFPTPARVLTVGFEAGHFRDVA